MAATSAADVARRGHSAHLVARNVARALEGSASAAKPLAACAQIVKDCRWPANIPWKLNKCRPALQVAWDLVSERAAARDP